jgi:aspartyl-tRNA(Asn)/glutamyl-tRNA(Gln) amidotransferase subunit B
MVRPEIRNQYIVTIGIECHVQLKTKTKLFAAVENDAREAPPNTLISHICLGMPGALPVLNKEAVRLASRAAFALGTLPQKFSKFDRKHYFYPDLPKGYQITQHDQPIIVGGHVDILVDGTEKRIGVTRAHLEEDAGKSTHPTGKDYSLVDLNRAGTPLLEIVSEPEIHSAAEAKAYAKALYLLMKYADVSEADLYYGNMRFDVNVSVSKTDKLGIRTETKNLNSFRSVERAVEYEVERQIERLEKGEHIVQETRGWDDAKQKTFSQRTKEDAHDYRYFPDPDIPPVVLDDAYIAKVKKEMPLSPTELRAEFEMLKIDAAAVETLLEEIPAGKCLHQVLESNAPKESAKKIANWLVTDVQSLVASGSTTWGEARLEISSLVELAALAVENKISSTGAKIVLEELVLHGGNVQQIAESKNVLQVSDESTIAEIVAKVLADNAQAANDVKNGEMKAIGFLVGQVMKASQGKANPGLAQQLIKKQLGI